MWLTNLISTLFGYLAAIPLPTFVRTPFYSLYARCFNADLSICSKPLCQYRSLSDFFTRDLEPGSRPLETGLISPVDGKLRNHGIIPKTGLEQIKGRYYSLEKLLQYDHYASNFQGGYYFNLYLAPGDYHHVHAPTDGDIIAMTYIPGSLFPVNDLSLNSLKDLFVKNERIVIYIRSTLGILALVMVGATNVGKMKVSFDSLTTNQDWWQRVYRTIPFKHTEYPTPIPIKAGDKLGTFCLGSTVVLLLPGGMEGTTPAIWNSLPAVIHYGQQLTRIINE